MEFPKDLRYSEEHEWVRVEGNKAYIGISAFAQAELGDIVFVELPEVGATIQQDEPFGSVESVKTVSDIFSPVSGKVTNVNGNLEGSPELVNSAPFGEGWMVEVEISGADALEGLLTADEYAAYTGNE